jgi:ribosome-associated toxin RatA of RatAB toxin-antitoxin module
MKHVKKSVLLWYAPEEIYRLVVAVPEYPAFLPWCERSEVLAEDEQGMTARIHLAYGGVRQAFTTRNRHEAGRSVSLELVDGPFSALQGQWRFTSLAMPGNSDGVPVSGPGGSAQASKVEFSLHYAFSSRPLEAVISPVFDRVASTLVDSFVKRAEQVYGPR